MKPAIGVTVIHNGKLVDGNGGTPVAEGLVIVDDSKIAYAGAAETAPSLPPDAKRIDARGGTIMPGLVEAHFHATYFNVADLPDLDTKYPAEYVTLRAAANCKLALECGYTAARSCGSLFNIDVWLKIAIEEDLHPGPRLATSGREICSRGGLMDWNPDYRQIGMQGLMLLIDGPVEARAAARKLVKDGVEWIKTYPSGDAAAAGGANDQHAICMDLDEMKAVSDTAHNHGLKVTGHCRAAPAIKNALLAHYDCIEHATFMTNETLDLLLSADTPVVHALQFEKASATLGARWGLSQAVIDGHWETLEAGVKSAQMIHKAGGRMGIGGDYGFAWTPHGTYADELTFFVNDVGFTPLEVITCATRTGAEIMGREKEFGSLEAGKLADILIVDGDVLADISLLSERENFIAVMQGGVVKAGRLQPRN